MTEAERHFLELLKRKVAERYCGERAFKPVEEWSANEIEGFQDDLKRTVQGSVSEKWFYTHFKGKEREKLPRIDTLDLLSRYAGYEGWEQLKSENPYEAKSSTGKKRLGKLGVLLLILGGGLFAFISFMTEDGKTYRVCFEDGDSGSPLRKEKLSVELLRKGESPLSLERDTNGCFEIPVEKGKARLIVKAPYYRTDTIVRELEGAIDEERVPLEKDDQALMIHSFSQPDNEELEKHRKQLERMIAPDARIFQVHGENGKGVELYNRKEFIDKLSMPLSSLKRIELLETRYDKNGKIRTIRFEQAAER